MRLATEKEKFQLLGPPGQEHNHESIDLPFRLQLSWMKEYYIKRFTCHKKVAPALKKIYAEIAELPQETIHGSGILIFGGCYAFRATRPTENKATPRWSAHAWAVAVDHDPKRNGLYWPASKSNITKYPEIIRIFNKYGFLNFGQAKTHQGIQFNRDWMHFEASYDLLTDPKLFING